MMQGRADFIPWPTFDNTLRDSVRAHGGQFGPTANASNPVRQFHMPSHPDLAFHHLRHTHASQLIDAGVDIVTISKRLGHAKPDITLRIYAHLFQKDDGKTGSGD
jgi:integrase